MTKLELEQALNTAVENFRADVTSTFNDAYSKEPVTQADMVELSKQTFYALEEFKNALLKYLD